MDTQAPITCPRPMGDAGFSSLADLPIAQLCTLSATGEGLPTGNVSKSSTPCQGSIIVQSPTATDCGSFWLFDAGTGALQAVGGYCDGDYSCTGSVAGFDFPSACFDHAHWGWGKSFDELCPDAGAPEGGAEAGEPYPPSGLGHEFAGTPSPAITWPTGPLGSLQKYEHDLPDVMRVHW